MEHPMSDFEDEYMDVLQNIEAGIVNVYREEPGLLDFEVDKVLNMLIREYQAETQNRTVPKPALTPKVERLYASVRAMCDWRIGRETLETEEGQEVEIGSEPITPEEIIACLKRVRKSVETWTKQGGRQGYLHYISQFI
jgi:hypothetical protein